MVQRLPWRWNVQGVVFLICCFAYVFDSFTSTLTGYVMPLVKPYWNLSNFQMGLYGTVTYVGMAVGAYFCGAIADMYGRKSVFIYSVFAYSLFSLASMIAPSYGVLMLFRFLAGVGMGGSVALIFPVIAEFMPFKIRGGMTVLVDIAWALGSISIGFWAAFLVPFHNWRLLFLVDAIPLILVVLAILYLPESPEYLIKKGLTDKANALLRQLVEKTNAKVTEWTFPEVVHKKENSLDIFANFVKVWSYNWKLTLGIWFVTVVMFIHRFGVTLWLPSILLRAGYSEQKAFITAGSVAAVGILGDLLGGLLADSMGRKKYIIINMILANICTVTFTEVLHITGLAQIVILAYGFFGEPLTNCLYAFITESYPTEIRATAFGCASMISRLTIAFLVSLVFGTVLWPLLGIANSFIVVFVVVVIGMIVLSFLPETSRKILD